MTNATIKKDVKQRGIRKQQHPLKNKKAKKGEATQQNIEK